MVAARRVGFRSAVGAALLLLWGAAPAGAGSEQAGTAGFQFLKLPQTARLAALGSAFVAEASDAAALEQNPAGLAQQRERRWAAAYSNLFTNVQSGFLSYTQALEAETVIGGAVTYLSSGDIPRRDANNRDLGVYGFSAIAVAVSVGTRLHGEPDTLPAAARRRFRDRPFKLDGGASVRAIYEKLDEYAAHGFAVDFGLLGHLPDQRTRLGVSVTHLGRQASGYLVEKDPLPTAVHAGFRHELREAPLTVVGAVVLPKDNKLRVGVGGELRLGGSPFRPAPFALRVGFHSQGRDLRTTADDSGIAGFSFGGGLLWRSYVIDYSFTPGLGLGSLHRFTLSGSLR